MIQFQAIAQLINKAFPYIVCAVLVFLYMSWQKEKERADIAVQNEKSNVDYLSKSDFKKALDTMGIKSKNVTEVTRVNTRTETIIKTPVYDSIIDSVQVHCVDWTNGYTSLNGCLESGAKLSHKDTLDLILKRVPTKKFLFIKYRKLDSLLVQNKDPNSKYYVNRLSRVKM